MGWGRDGLQCRKMSCARCVSFSSGSSLSKHFNLRSHYIAADRSPEILRHFIPSVVGNLGYPKSRTDRKRDLSEVLVFLFFIVPSMIISFFTLGGGNPHFAIMSCSLILNDLAYISLIAFFLWRNGEPFTNIGWKFHGVKKEAALGAGLFFPLMVCVSLIEKGFQHIGLLSHMNRLPEFLPSMFVRKSCCSASCNSSSDSRGDDFSGLPYAPLYPPHREPLSFSHNSSVFFSLGQRDEGFATMVTICISGMIVALIYVWRKSLVAPM